MTINFEIREPIKERLVRSQFIRSIRILCVFYIGAFGASVAEADESAVKLTCSL